MKVRSREREREREREIENDLGREGDEQVTERWIWRFDADRT